MVGSNRNTVQGFINDIVGNTDSRTVVEGNNKTTDEDIRRPPNLLGPSIPESTLRRIPKKVMKEAVEDKKVEQNKILYEDSIQRRRCFTSYQCFGFIWIDQ